MPEKPSLPFEDIKRKRKKLLPIKRRYLKTHDYFYHDNKIWRVRFAGTQKLYVHIEAIAICIQGFPTILQFKERVEICIFLQYHEDTKFRKVYSKDPPTRLPKYTPVIGHRLDEREGWKTQFANAVIKTKKAPLPSKSKYDY